jgi:DNA-binding IclR family transcriptional regulator
MMVKSADRTILILEKIAGRKNGLTHGELSAALQIPKSSLTSLLANLQKRNYLSFDRDNKHYALGPQILILASHYLAGLDLFETGQPIINDLMAVTEESAGLTVKKGDEILTVYNKNCSHPIMHSLKIGERAPIYATAAGRAILAHLPAQEIHQYLESVELKAITPATLTDPNRILSELKTIRTSGIAYCREEFHEGSTAMAAAVFDMHGEVTASIHVVAPSIRFSARKENIIADALRRAAAELSYRLGFSDRGIPPCLLTPQPIERSSAR